MRRWRRKKEDEDDLEEYEEDEDEDEEDERPKKRYPPPRPLRVTRFHDLFDEDEEEDEGPKFEDLEANIRAGKYKPKPEDPWTAHILYQNLKALGEI